MFRFHVIDMEGIVTVHLHTVYDKLHVLMLQCYDVILNSSTQ